MKIREIAPGVWPTMLTPFTEKGNIDYDMVEKLVDWYIERGVGGIFAVCQSSEMFYLSRDEKRELATFVHKSIKGRVGMVASGHTADSLEDQAYEINEMAQTGAQCVVLLPNRLAARDESDDVLKANLDILLSMVDKDIVFGVYECPAPYKRLLTPELVYYLADMGRFIFLKDTCCNANQVIDKIRAGRGILKVYNANSAQLYQTLKAGAAGFSGVMANFHPELYSWLCKNFANNPEFSESISSFLGVISAQESRGYPLNAKKYLKTFFFSEMSDFTRSVNRDNFNPGFYTELLQLNKLYREYLECKNLDLGVKI